MALSVPRGAPYPAIPGAHYAKMLVGDLQNDRFDDIVVLGDKGSHLFKFGTNGLATDVSDAEPPEHPERDGRNADGPGFHGETGFDRGDREHQ